MKMEPCPTVLKGQLSKTDNPTAITPTSCSDWLEWPSSEAVQNSSKHFCLQMWTNDTSYELAHFKHTPAFTKLKQVLGMRGNPWMPGTVGKASICVHVCV